MCVCVCVCVCVKFYMFHFWFCLLREESQNALDTFNSIKGNLSEIQTLNNQTKVEVDELTAKNASVYQILAEVCSEDGSVFHRQTTFGAATKDTVHHRERIRFR